MRIKKIVNSWNFNSFLNCSILKIYYCSKLKNSRNFMFFEISKLQIFRIFNIFKNFQIEIFLNLPNSKLLGFSKLKIFEFSKFKVLGIVQIRKLRNSISIQLLNFYFMAY